MVTRKRSQSRKSAPEVPIEVPWWKSTWLKATAGIAALALVLGNVNSILSNARALPGEFRKTSDQFFDWYGEYKAWEGHWTNFPEVFVDMKEMNLSDEGFRLNIDGSDNGELGGTIETRGICDNIPYFDQLMFDGTISSSGRADIDVFDYVGGYRRNFAKLKLKRNDYIMTVVPLDDPGKIFSPETRIARAPPDLVGTDLLEPFCKDKRYKFIRDALKDAKS
jgi:hypothetical protein